MVVISRCSLCILPLFQAITCPDFWLRARFVSMVGHLCEHCSRWAEGCICHSEHRRIYNTATPMQKRGLPDPFCHYRGSKAPEMAAGDCLKGLRCEIQQTEPLLRHHLREATQAEVATNLLGEWGRALSTTSATLFAKLRYWQELPYMLCALAHPDEAVVAWHKVMDKGCQYRH